MSCECTKADEFKELKEEIKDVREEVKVVREELHDGDKRFLLIDGKLERHGEALETQTKALREILMQTKQNAHIMFAIKWVTIGVGGTLIALKMGLLDLVMKVVFK